jgi:hypothetical protein
VALADNLIAYWTLDEASGTRNDSVGSSHLADTNTVGSAAGKLGSAASFVAANSECLSRADNADLSTGDIDFTLAAWVQLTGTATTRPILGKQSSAAVREYRLQYEASNTRFRFLVFNAAGSVVGDVSASNFGPPSAGVLYHVAAWHDAANNQVGIAVNGGTPNTAATTGAPADTAATFYLGFDAANAVYFDGLIDEVGLWKRVLTSQDRTDLYNGGAGLAFSSFGGGSASTGSASITLAPLTCSATGSLAITGTAAVTLGGLTLSAAGAVAVTGAAAVTLAPLTLTSGGVVALTGSLDATLAAVTLTAGGASSSTAAGTLDVTLAPVTLTSTGALALTGSVGATLAPLTLTSAGTLTDGPSGQLAATLAPLTLAAAGAVALSGAAAAALAPLTLSAAAALAVTGTLTVTLGSLTLHAAGSAAGDTAHLVYAPAVTIGRNAMTITIGRGGSSTTI